MIATRHRHRIAVLWLGSGTVVAALLNWHFRFNASGDTVNYLEIASKFALGRLTEAVVRYSSPLYSWLLIPVISLPRSRHLPAAHVLQVVLFIFALWAAWRLVTMLHRTGTTIAEGELVLVLGVALTASLTVIPSRYLTPDLLAFGLVLWLVARVGEEAGGASEGPWRRCATGSLWGAGYLARTYVAAFGGVVLLLASVMVRRNKGIRQHVRWLGVYAVGFLLTGGPWIVTLSLREGRVTWGAAGTTNILVAFDREPIQPAPWPVPLANGRVLSHERPFPLTVPESYDVVPGGTFRYPHVWRTYARILVGNVEALFFGFYPPDLPLFWPLGILAVLAWVVCVPGARHPQRQPSLAAWLLLSGATGLLMFVAVHVESRYVAPFLVLVAAGIAQRSSVSPPDRRQAHVPALALVGVLFWSFPFLVWLDGMRSSRAPQPGSRAEIQWLAEHGGRYTAVGATYDLGIPAWLSETEVIASVDLVGSSPEVCDAVAAVLRGLRVVGIFGARGTIECGPWQSVPESGWAFWNLQATTPAAARQP